MKIQIRHDVDDGDDDDDDIRCNKCGLKHMQKTFDYGVAQT